MKVICIENKGFSDLTIGKTYEVIGDCLDWIRIIDDSDEDYLYPFSYFTKA